MSCHLFGCTTKGRRKTDIRRDGTRRKVTITIFTMTRRINVYTTKLSSILRDVFTTKFYHGK